MMISEWYQLDRILFPNSKCRINKGYSDLGAVSQASDLAAPSSVAISTIRGAVTKEGALIRRFSPPSHAASGRLRSGTIALSTRSA